MPANKLTHIDLFAGIQSEDFPLQAIDKDSKQSHLLKKNHTARNCSSSGSGLLPTPRNCSALVAEITPESAHAPNRFPNLETVVGRGLLPTPHRNCITGPGTSGRQGE